MRKSFSLLPVAAVIMSAMLSASCCGGCKSEPAAEGYVPSAADTVSSVLVVVDVQRDFFSPEGSLYVNGSEELPAKIAQIAGSFDAVIFTLDWHPGDHCSFKAQGGIWPSHCVAYTQGAGLADEFAQILAQGPDKVQLFFKGTDPQKEQYGAFEGLSEGRISSWLKTAQKVAVCGIAGDYCVKESTKNILSIVPADKVTILSDCIRSIDDGSTITAFAAENKLNQE